MGAALRDDPLGTFSGDSDWVDETTKMRVALPHRVEMGDQAASIRRRHASIAARSFIAPLF